MFRFDRVMNQSQKNYYSEKEQELVKLLREGNTEAFEAIFKLYWKDLYKHAYQKVHNKEEAEEIVQDIFTSLWAKRNELLITNLNYYLHTAVRNRVLNQIRSKIVHEKYWAFYKQFIPRSSSSTEESVRYNEVKTALDKGVSYLSGKSKIVFLLSRVKGLSNAQIATKLNLSEKAVEYHLTRSLKKLRTHLKDYLPSLPLFLSLYLTNL